MDDRNAWNRQTIEEFRTHKGRVGGVWEGRPLLLLTTTCAKIGQRRTNPMMSLREGDSLFIFTSKGGAPTHPDWYYNLLAQCKRRWVFTIMRIIRLILSIGLLTEP